jgi:hypothetical protein
MLLEEYMSEVFTIKTNKKLELEDIFDKLAVNYKNLSAIEEDDNCVFFYLNGKSIRGVYIFSQKIGYEIKCNVLSNNYDLMLANEIIKNINSIVDGTVYNEENEILDGNEYISVQNIENNFIRDLDTIFTYIKETGNTVEFPGTTRSFFIGKKLYSTYKDFNKNVLINVFQKTILNVLYGLPDYYVCSPMGADSKEEGKIIKLKCISSENDYIIQDYDFILISDEEEMSENDLIMVSVDKIYKILPSKWQIVDECTIVAPKLTEIEWKQFKQECIKNNCYKEFKEKAK